MTHNSCIDVYAPSLSLKINYSPKQSKAMIQANDLRIGNYISYKNERWIKVGYHEIRYAVLYPDTSYYPIPLTPEILKKAGFEKRTYSNDFFIVCGKESKKTNGLFIEISIDDNYSCSIGQLKNFSHQFGEYKSLHQLQNLYFALTGQELNVVDGKSYLCSR